MTREIAQNQQNRIGYVPAPREILSFLKRPLNTEARDTSELLRTAYDLLAQAEREISKKDDRIKSLETMLTVDELTGLTNRHGFYQNFTRELDRTNRGENDGGLLVMIDLDFFKAINDTFGHQAGDEALRIVGDFLNAQIRNMDVAARLGGDEFILLLPNTSSEQALQRVTSIGEALNQLSFDWDGAALNIHASLGVKEYKGGDSIESIIEQADQSMYQSKAKRHSVKH